MQRHYVCVCGCHSGTAPLEKQFERRPPNVRWGMEETSVFLFVINGAQFGVSVGRLHSLALCEDRRHKGEKKKYKDKEKDKTRPNCNRRQRISIKRCIQTGQVVIMRAVPLKDDGRNFQLIFTRRNTEQEHTEKRKCLSTKIIQMQPAGSFPISPTQFIRMILNLQIA